METLPFRIFRSNGGFGERRIGIRNKRSSFGIPSTQKESSLSNQNRINREDYTKPLINKILLRKFRVILASTESQISSVLLIDRPCRRPAVTRFRSTGLDGKILETSFDTTFPTGFHRHSLQNSCKNLFCFAQYATAGHSACLLDLGAKKAIMLPESKNLMGENRTSFYGLGFDRRSNRHKTLRIDALVDSDGLYNFVERAEVNTAGEETWERVMGELPSGSIFGKPVAVNGALVWADFPQTDVSSSSQKCAAVFNFDDQKVSTVRLPPNIKVGHLVALKGNLCAVDLSSDSGIQIWVLRELDGAWESLCRIMMRTGGGETDHGRTRVVGSLANGELLIKSYGAYFVYEAETERLRYLPLPRATDSDTVVLCC